MLEWATNNVVIKPGINVLTSDLWKYRRKTPWPNLNYYLDIHLQGLMKITKIPPAYVIWFETGNWDVLGGKQCHSTAKRYNELVKTPSVLCLLYKFVYITENWEAVSLSGSKIFAVFCRNRQVLWVVTTIRHKTQCVNPPDEVRTTMNISPLWL